MIILPAIDLIGGRAVRLLHGDYSKMTVYSEDPAGVARDFMACGATEVHLVDLEAARDGKGRNREIIREICSLGLVAEAGGGVRSAAAAEELLKAGCARVILGTVAVTQPETTREILRSFPGQVAVSVDCKDGYVAVHGWESTSSLHWKNILERLLEDGCSRIICTDIARDGALAGSNHELYREMLEMFPGLHLTASGGVSSLEEIGKLRSLGLSAAILGKAYYTGDVDLRQAIEVAK